MIDNWLNSIMDDEKLSVAEKLSALFDVRAEAEVRISNLLRAAAASLKEPGSPA